MSEPIGPMDQTVMDGLLFDLWWRREQANRIMHRGVERFHRRHEIYAAYAKEKGRDPETLTALERKEAILGSILDEVED